MIAAGVILVSRPTGRLLLVERSRDVSYSGTWCVPGGEVEEGEDPVDGAVRELLEETGCRSALSLLDLVAVHRIASLEFHYVFASVASEFRPKLNWESSAAAWCTLNFPPRPLHPLFQHFLRYHGDGVVAALRELRQ